MCTYSLTSHTVPQRHSLHALTLTSICVFFVVVFSTIAVTLTRYCGKTISSNASTHTNTAPYSHTSLLTIKNPWPLGIFTAAHPNASSLRSFISRKCISVRSRSTHVGGGLYRLWVSPPPKILHSVPRVTPTTAHLHQSNTVFYDDAMQEFDLLARWVVNRWLIFDFKRSHKCVFSSRCMHLLCSWIYEWHPGLMLRSYRTYSTYCTRW